MKLTRQQMKALTAIGIVVMLCLLGIAGRIDYTEAVMYNMPNSVYNEIKDTLGEKASDHEIVKYYQKNYR